MKRTYKSMLFCWALLLGGFLPSLPAQSLEQSLQFAHQQYASGQYAGAAKAYRRVLFFGEDSIGKQVFQPLAACYMVMGESVQAQKYLDLAYSVADSETEQAAIIYKKATAYLFADQARFALQELFHLSPEDQAGKQKQAFYIALTHFQLEEFSRSEAAFLESIGPDHPEQLAQIEALFAQQAKLKRRYSPKAAQWMSTFLPGLGQLYIGEYEASLNSFLLVGGLILVFGYTANNLGVIDAIITVLPWYQRYFFGGAQGAARLAQQKIDRKRAEIYQQLLDEVAASKR